MTDIFKIECSLVLQLDIFLPLVLPTEVGEEAAVVQRCSPLVLLAGPDWPFAGGGGDSEGVAGCSAAVAEEPVE